MIEKNEMLQMLDSLERMVWEVEKEMECRVDLERSDAIQRMELEYHQLERKMDLLEEKVYKNVSYTMLSSLA